MRVAVISDLHGNWHALEAVLADLAHERPDRVVCAGDIVNPFLRSRETWLKLKELRIPCVRGNHEDYVASYYRPELRPEIRDGAQFRPVQLVARHLGEEMARELSALPLEQVIPGPGGDDLYVCHASPGHNSRSYWLGIDPSMTAALRSIKARTIVGGHIHQQWTREWEDKTLIIAGSVGLPLGGEPRAQYVILEHGNANAGWQARHKTTAYDVEAALREYRESGCLERGGPIAWMLYDEIWTAQSRLVPFFKGLHQAGIPLPMDIGGLEGAAEGYLRAIDRWNALRSAIGR